MVQSGLRALGSSLVNMKTDRTSCSFRYFRLDHFVDLIALARPKLSDLVSFSCSRSSATDF